MVPLIDSLTEAVTKQKLTKFSKVSMQAFVDFEDTRDVGNAAYGAAQCGSNRALRLLHERGADLNAPNIAEGSRPVHIASQRGHTSTVQLLADMKADVHARYGQGGVATSFYRSTRTR